MNTIREKDRDISILEYFNVLQSEYIYFELRSKIYPAAKDKNYFRKVMEFKESKIRDISGKNNLISIFDSEHKMNDFRKMFFDSNGMPKRLGKRDWYFYYKIDSDFSYMGEGVKLKKYDIDEKIAIVQLDTGDMIQVALTQISRIL